MQKKTTKKLESKTRRGALKSASTSAFVAVAATQIPGQWKKPVVDSIIIPAHAVTTDIAGGGGDLTTTAVTPTVAPTTVAPTTVAPGTTIMSTMMMTTMIGST